MTWLVGIIIIYLATITIVIYQPKWGLYIFLGLLPFQPLLKTLLEKLGYSSDLNLLLISSWKEFFIIALFLFITIKGLTKKKRISIIKSDYLIVALFGLASISALIFHSSIGQLIFGIKYDLLFLLLYYSVRQLDLTKKDYKNILLIFLIEIGLVVFFSIYQSIVGNQLISFFGQRAQMIGSQIRLFGTLSGPNQLGSYLTFAFLIIVSLIANKANIIDRKLLIFLSVITFITVILSFSRSAWLGLIIGGLILLILNSKNGWRSIINGKTIVITVIGVSIIGLIVYYFSPQLINRHTDQERVERINQSINIFADNPFGLGIGKTGPASQWARNNIGIISENYYLQIGLELGLAGLIIYLWLLISILSLIYHSIKNGIDDFRKTIALGTFAGLVSGLVANLFLHTLADATLAYSLAIFIGLSVNNNLNKPTN